MPHQLVFIRTYGCTYNHADSDTLAGVLAAAGYRIAEREEDAGVIVINTCTVKGATEQKTLEKIKSLVASKTPFVICGCLSEANPALVRKYAPAAPFVGTRSLSRIPIAIEAALARAPSDSLAACDENKFSLPRVHGSVFARIPLAEGCLGACAYCQTKRARGALKSYPPGDIVREVERCVQNGSREIQLTAQDTGAYGFDIKTDLPSLINRISAIEGEFRVRVGMINPEHALRLLPELLDAYDSEKVYKFLHIPVQSGSDRVLRDMRRNYTIDDALNVIRAFRKRFPDSTIATDIIVGYPTETEADFHRTLALLKKAKFEVVNVSKFTPRPFTPAAQLTQLPNQLMKRRSRETAVLCKSISLEANEKLIGRKFRVLVTEQQRKGFSGRTDAYRQVALAGQQTLGTVKTCRIASATHSYLVASCA